MTLTQKQIDKKVADLFARLENEVPAESETHKSLAQAIKKLSDAITQIEKQLQIKESEDIKAVKELVRQARDPLERALGHFAILSTSHQAHTKNLSAEEFSLEHWEEMGKIIEATEKKAEKIGMTRQDILTVINALTQLTTQLKQLSNKTKQAGKTSIHQTEGIKEAAKPLLDYLDYLNKSVKADSHEGLRILKKYLENILGR